MSTKYVPVSLGLNTRSGKGPRPGYLLKARNSRYLPGDTSGRLWAVLGRTLFNADGFPAGSSGPAADDGVLKAIFPYYAEDGSAFVVAHKGGWLFEAPMGATGSFVEKRLITTGFGGAPLLATPRGIPFSYRNKAYYPSGPDPQLGLSMNLWARDPSGWVQAGFSSLFLYLFTAAPFGAGTYASTTQVLYTYRYYQSSTGAESAHGPVVTQAPFSGAQSVRLTFAGGVQGMTERDTHVRIYASLLSEPAGKLYRVDAGGNGIVLPIAPGATVDISTDNITALINGVVPADGEEASLSWAEYGGAPPPGIVGGEIFANRACVWGVFGHEDRVYYSAGGQPELFPVDFDGQYQYYLTFSTSKQDRVMVCRNAGPYLLVFNQNSIFRVLSLPTYADAGFTREVQDTLTRDHGVCSRWAADTFGIGPEESSWCIYVSREHGPMITNGVSDRPILDRADWLGRVNKEALDQVVVRNYPTMQEVWIFYPPKGQERNTEAVIIDYSTFAIGVGSSFTGTSFAGLRITGPVDVKADDAFLGWAATGEAFYLASSTPPYLYIQDSGPVDEQQNIDADGGIPLEWSIPTIRLAGTPFRTASLQRVAVEGVAGTQRVVNVTMYAQDGVEEYSVDDVVALGPGDTDDSATAGISGNSHRVDLALSGPSGSTYDEESADCAPGLLAVDLEWSSIGTQRRSSGT